MLKDEDVMINVVVSKPKTTDRQSKTQLKRQKFSRKFREKLKSREKSISRKEKGGLSSMYDDQRQEEDKQPQQPQKNEQPQQQLKKESNKNPSDRQSRSPNKSHQQRMPRQPIVGQNASETISAVQVKKSLPVPKEMVLLKPKLSLKKDIHNIEQAQLHPSLKSALEAANLINFTDVQKQSIQPLRQGRNAVIKAETGSGKTLAYLIPLIDNLIKSGRIKGRQSGTFVVVICPTRQLCLQSEKQAWKCLKRAPFIVPGSLMGGESVKKEKARLRKGMSIVFSTPGRLEYHIQNTQSFKYENLSYVVFDQADKTLDMGYRKELNNIFTIMKEKLSDFNMVQKILVSAHFNQKIQDLIDSIQAENVQYIGFSKDQGKEINISKQLRQTFTLVSQEERIPFLLSYLSLLKECQVLIFLSTIDEVEWMEYLLTTITYKDSNGQETQQKIEPRNILKLHGNIDQKIRSKTYFEFRQSKNSILLSTEVASRGLDFPDLSHIILLDVPATITDYANRIGRTARMNSTGVSIIILNYQESPYVQQLKVYTPTIEPVDKDIIIGGFRELLEKMNIRQQPTYYLSGLVRGLVRDDPDKYQMARRAYVSMLRAYARLPNKDIFKVKQLNLRNLARNFGLNSAIETNQAMASKKKQNQDNDYETQRRKRKPQDVRRLQIQQFL